MTKIIEGEPAGKGRRIGIVASRFNEEITTRLLRGAMTELITRGVKKEAVLIAWVPGAFEIPFMTQELVRKRKCDGVITLGAVIRGETAHFDYVCEGLASGIMNIQLETKIPISFGVLTTDTDRQAIERSGGKHGNKGKEAADVLLRMLDLKGKLKE